MTFTWTLHPSPLGELLLTDHGDGLSGLYFDDHRRGRPTTDAAARDDARFGPVTAALDAYLDGDATHLDVTTDPRGTPRQREVWDALTTIPRGRTVSYGELAAAVGRPSSARAVAAAVGANPLSIVVPCHRVIGADGRLTGYAGGLDRKRWLLRHEGVVLSGGGASPAR